MFFERPDITWLKKKWQEKKAIGYIQKLKRPPFLIQELIYRNISSWIRAESNKMMGWPLLFLSLSLPCVSPNCQIKLLLLPYRSACSI